MMVQGFAPQSIVPPLPNSGPVFQFPVGLMVILPTALFPPPGVTPTPPVGIAGSPRVFSNARDDSQFTVSYIMPAPARSTVFPEPKGSHSIPKRGAKLLWSPLY